MILWKSNRDASHGQKTLTGVFFSVTACLKWIFIVYFILIVMIIIIKVRVSAGRLILYLSPWILSIFRLHLVKGFAHKLDTTTSATVNKTSHHGPFFKFLFCTLLSKYWLFLLLFVKLELTKRNNYCVHDKLTTRKISIYLFFCLLFINRHIAQSARH